MSQRYSMLVMSSERLSISSRIACVTALISPFGSGADVALPEPPARGGASGLGLVEGGAWARTQEENPMLDKKTNAAQMSLMIAIISSQDLAIEVGVSTKTMRRSPQSAR